MSRRGRNVGFILIGSLTIFISGHWIFPSVVWMFQSEKNCTVRVLQRDPSKLGAQNCTDSSLHPNEDKAVVYRFNGKKFERLNEFCTKTKDLKCVMLKTPAGVTPVHIHSIFVDQYVSCTIQETGTWEPENVQLILQELKRDPELGFLDLGSHIGAYSLSAAKFGRKVVSVDPLKENLQRLCKSIERGGFTKQMTIIFNPLSNKHSLVKFMRDVTNVGGTSMVTANRTNLQFADSVSVMLDDIIPFLPFKKAVIKMDIQEFEYRVLKAASSFFEQIYVSAILMEWVMMATSKDSESVIALMLKYGFKVYEPTVGGDQLDIKEYKNWPYDVLWRR